MKLISKANVITTLLMALNSVAGFASILPPNDLHKYDRQEAIANMTEPEFNSIIDSVSSQYTSIVQAHGAQLKMENNWTDSTVNAYASQQGSDWLVHMFGGLARRPEITKDGFALVVCHELGHHLAGFPLKGDRWAATEGQSDYFATQSCAKRIWSNDPQTISHDYRGEIPGFVADICDEQWHDTTDQAVCYRTQAASVSLANLLSALSSGPTPSFDIHDPTVVEQTYQAHPNAQCRLDTYSSGAICQTAFEVSNIPGRNHPSGQHSLDAELVASESSCMEAKGLDQGNRPKCWFAPKLNFLGTYPVANNISMIEGNANGSIDPGETWSFNLTLRNYMSSQASDVMAIASSADPSITILENTMLYDPIAPRTISHATQPLVLSIDRASNCGREIPITIETSSDLGGDTIQETLLIGERLILNGGTIQEDIHIPNSATVSSEMEITQNTQVKRLFLQINATHNYASDVYVRLKSPSGQTYEVARLQRTPDHRINSQFTVDLEELSDAQGIWTLELEDTYHIDDGTLHSWSMELESFTCESVSFGNR
jgi:subtilisin-like proprotein convertase family protein